ncbi:unnamed protein product [Soboliphyme baturini]|uniref:Platelet-derived growth factor receptor-like protein n=1 Tax=Soboliphyme baturini TaxID=241478 RepID=A0A183I8R2_9BILA|nr:unnamed protein product [Soboliphyme baturini]
MQLSPGKTSAELLINDRPEDGTILKTAGDELELSCTGTAGLKLHWVKPDNSIYKGYDDPVSSKRLFVVNRDDEGYSKLTLMQLRWTDTGWYRCVSDNASKGQYTTNLAGFNSVYLFVTDKDPQHLFLHWVDEDDNYSNLIPVSRKLGGYISCLVTNPNARVSFHSSTPVKISMEAYDPKRGFFVQKNSLDSSAGILSYCTATLDSMQDEVRFLFLVVDDSQVPEPEIDRSGAMHPYVSGSMSLSCLNKFIQSFEGVCKWSFPSMNELESKSRILEMNHVDALYNTTLYFKFLLLEDSGRYECTCSNIGVEYGETAFVDITVSAVKGEVTFNETGEESKICHEDDSLQLQANFTAWPLNELSVQWFQKVVSVENGVQLFPVSNPSKDDGQSSTLELHRLRVSDSGQYICSVTAAQLVANKTFYLTVLASPKITDIFVSKSFNILERVASQFLQLNRTYHVNCIGEGIPLPNLYLYWKPCLDKENCQWFPLPDSGIKVEILNGTFQSLAFVTELTTTVKTYKCALKPLQPAEDPDSLEGRTISLVPCDIEDAEKLLGFGIVAEAQNSTDPVYDSQQIKISCRFQKWFYRSPAWSKENRNNTISNRMNITWIPIPDEKIFTSTTEWSRHADLIFSPVNHADSGIYRCCVRVVDTNQTVCKSRRLDVVQTVAPSFSELTSNHSLIATFRDSFEIVCIADGVPKPSITWFKNGVLMTQSARHGISLTSHKLTISRVIGDDAGLYLCVAENLVGTSTRNFTLTVLGLTSGTVSDSDKKILTICLAVLGVFIVALICMVVEMRRRDSRRVKLLKQLYNQLVNSTENKTDIDPKVPVNEQTENLCYDISYEIRKENLKLVEELGSGHFGRVWKGYILDDQGNEQLCVAVKVPKGTVTLNHGGELDPSWSQEMAQNFNKKTFMSTSDLLCFAYQVANGMEYLIHTVKKSQH